MDPMQVLGDIRSGLSPDWQVATGSWFGKPCLKVGGRVFAAFWQGDVAFKLAGEDHAAALQVEGAQLFDPRGQGRPLKHWVQVPAARSATWVGFARLACQYVAREAQALKDRLITGLVVARRRVLDAACSLPPKQQGEVFLGTWSAKDLLAHLVGWDLSNRQAVQEILAGQKPGFWQHYDRDWQSYNARLIAQHKVDSFDRLVALAGDSHRSLIEYLGTVPAEEMLKRRSIATLLLAESRDENEHSEQLHAFHRARLTGEFPLNPFHRSRQ
jgi:hypothetical protein